MRADRLVSILLLLQSRGRATARQLAGELEVSERTILRDMDALAAAGVPVVSARGANGGWSVVDGYRTRLNGLNESELRALFVSAPASVLADLNLDAASRAARLKLHSALPHAAEYARQRIHVDVSGWRDSRDAVPFLPALQDAAFRERRVRIEYTHGPREVDPLGLVAKGHLWYLVAAFEGAPRTYRVSRITGVAVLDAPAMRPANFDLAAYWEESKKSFLERLPRVDVAALVPRELLPRVRMYLRYGAIDRVEDYDETRVRVEMHFDSAEAAEVSLRWDGIVMLSGADGEASQNTTTGAS